MTAKTPLWSPSKQQKDSAHVEIFRNFINQRFDLELADFQALHAWSVEQSADFWSVLWDYADIKCQTRGDAILENPRLMPGARWFPEARLNFAENLLRLDAASPALMFKGEEGDIRSISRPELYQQVRAVAATLRKAGVGVGDRVAGFIPNIPESLIAMLATSSIGAIWSSCSPDFGINGVMDRFGQIEPKVLITADGYRYGGKQHDSLNVASELVESVRSINAVIVVSFLNSETELTGRAANLAIAYDQILKDDAAVNSLDTPMHFEQLPFDHPLYIMFSSGTTGKPKCIVHGAGGTLLQHVKEHLLHVDLKPGDKLFFFTTCGWMMWNWLVSALAVKATVLLYDGSPFYPDGNTLFDYAEQSGMTQFGTSAKFIDACNKADISPVNSHKLPELKSLLSTGSPLVPESFDYVYKHIGADICLSSMSGGTDIVSCFILGNPAAPVYRGELQCKGLGMDIQVYSDNGEPLPPGEKGELVCANPFPCMPTGFFGDDDGSRYHAAYFEKFPNVWCHGDYVAESDTGGMIIYGRSDAVLNPGGVRIGTAEIYRQVESFEEVVEALVIGQRWNSDVRVVLFLRLREGVTLNDDLQTRLKSHIREQTTPRHVPARIVQVSDIPRTRSGKIVELAVGKVVHGESIDNIEALANPEALDLFANLPELQS